MRNNNNFCNGKFTSEQNMNIKTTVCHRHKHHNSSFLRYPQPASRTQDESQHKFKLDFVIFCRWAMGMKGEWLLGESKARLPGLTVCLWSFTIALIFWSHLPCNCCPEKVENPRERIAIDLRLGKKFVVRWCTVAKDDRSEIYQQSVALEIGKTVGCQL